MSHDEQPTFHASHWMLDPTKEPLKIYPTKSAPQTIAKLRVHRTTGKGTGKGLLQSNFNMREGDKHA
jgi:hypothetical protein